MSKLLFSDHAEKKRKAIFSSLNYKCNIWTFEQSKPNILYQNIRLDGPVNQSKSIICCQYPIKIQGLMILLTNQNRLFVVRSQSKYMIIRLLTIQNGLFVVRSQSKYTTLLLTNNNIAFVINSQSKCINWASFYNSS